MDEKPFPTAADLHDRESYRRYLRAFTEALDAVYGWKREELPIGSAAPLAAASIAAAVPAAQQQEVQP